MLARTNSHQPSIRAAQPVDIKLLRAPEELERSGMAFVKTSQWTELDESTHNQLEETAVRVDERGADVEEVSLPEKFGSLVEAQSTIFQAELSRTLSHEFEKPPDQLSDVLYGFIESGDAAEMDECLEAQKLAAKCRWESMANCFGTTTSCWGPAAGARLRRV